MNKKVKIILGIVIILLITCSIVFFVIHNNKESTTNFNTNEINTNNEAMNNNSNKNYSFRAIVVNSTEKTLEVQPIEEKDINLLSNRVKINLDENNDVVYFEGAELLITYTGEIIDSYPTQIKVINIQTETDYKAKIENLPADYSLIQAIRDN